MRADTSAKSAAYWGKEYRVTPAADFDGLIIDVSSNNGEIDWKRARAAGVGSAYIRSTMGGSGVDTRWHYNTSAAIAAGVTVGYYHLFRPDSDGLLQARYALSKLNPIPLSLAVDVEHVVAPQRVLTLAQYADELAAFVQHIKAETGEYPVIYTSAGEWNALVGTQHDELFAQCDLWIANYTAALSPLLARCWKTYVLWQWTSSGRVDGINSRVDLNRRPPAAPIAPTRFELYTPFEANVVTSRFNDPRDYSFAPHRLQLHEGEDSVDGDGGLTVYCGRAGKVVKVGFDARGYGRYLIVDFGGGWTCWLAHFERIDVQVGQQVQAKQALGSAGRTGSATGIHAHLTLCNTSIGLDNYVVPKVVNPEQYLVKW